MRSDKKVIILDNIKSDCIEQAMFILKDKRPENIDAVREAEQIIENYTRKYHYNLYSKMLKKRKISGAVISGVALGIIAFIGILCALWLI